MLCVSNKVTRQSTESAYIFTYIHMHIQYKAKGICLDYFTNMHLGICITVSAATSTSSTCQFNVDLCNNKERGIKAGRRTVK